MVDGIWFSAQTRERRAGVRKGIHANAEPRHDVAAAHANQAEEKNDRQRREDRLARYGREYPEIQNNDDGDKDPEKKEKFALGDEVGLAGFVDKFGDFAHGAMHGHVLQAGKYPHAKEQTEDADQDAKQKELVAVNP